MWEFKKIQSSFKCLQKYAILLISKTCSKFLKGNYPARSRNLKGSSLLFLGKRGTGRRKYVLLSNRIHDTDGHLPWHNCVRKSKTKNWFPTIRNTFRLKFIIYRKKSQFYHILYQFLSYWKNQSLLESLWFSHDKFFRNYLVEILEDTILTLRKIVCVLPYILN